MEQVGYIEGDQNGNTIRETMFAYSEEEKQQQEIDRENAKLVFSPKFIPFSPSIQKQYKLSIIETLVYGFIDFYLYDGGKRFYFTDKQLAEIIGCGERIMSSSIKTLSDMGLINKKQKLKAGGGTIRFIQLPKCKNNNLETAQCAVSKVHSVQANNNNINKNNKQERVAIDFLLDQCREKGLNPIVEQTLLTLKRLGYAPPAGETLESFVERLQQAMPTEETAKFKKTYTKRMTEFETYWKEETKNKKQKPNWKSKLLYNFNNFRYDN